MAFADRVGRQRSEGAFLAEVIGIAHRPKGGWTVDLSNYGAVVIQTQHVDEW